LRTTSNGNLVNEDTGDWLVLRTPPHDWEDLEIVMKNKEVAKGPSIGLPESENRTTGLDGPRAHESLGRLWRNKWHRFDYLPAQVENIEA
jgi:hypothetical protein